MELLERDDALATLGEARASATRGQGRVVVITGEPGIGKTSLVTRLLDEIEDDRGRRVSAVRDPCSSAKAVLMQSLVLRLPCGPRDGHAAPSTDP